jgi:hypothetical protein
VDSLKVKKAASSQKSSNSFFASTWLFPGILAAVLILLTALQVSGTSIGIYNSVFYGGQKDPSLVFGHPRPIRSDEWIVNTQLIIAQQAAGYPKINPNIDNGRDMSLAGDVPYKDWSAVLKPQNLIFFVLPLSFAFAFKWWSILFLLMASVYFFILKLFPRKRFMAALFATGFSLSPFVFWWYQTTTIAPLFYGFLILIIGIRIIDKEPVRILGKKQTKYSSPLYILALSYLLSCFALVLYPPFQIPIAIVVALFLLGYLLDKKAMQVKIFSKEFLGKITPIIVSCILTAAVILAFIHAHSASIKAITHTVYPGARAVKSGGMKPYQILSSHLEPQLQRNSRAANYFTNQSEASNFILLWPFLALPGIAITITEWVKRRRVDWAFVSVQAVCFLFIFHMFVPGFNILYKPFLLDKVPHERLLIGLGFAGFIQMLFIVRKLVDIKLSKTYRIATSIYSALVFGVLLIVGLYTKTHFPKFISSVLLICALSLVLAVIIWAMLFRKTILAGILILAFSFSCVFYIHPIYKGLGPLSNSKVLSDIKTVSKPGEAWAVVDDIYFENFALLSNRDSLSGVHPYPDLNFWRQVEGPKGDFIYNRYAHVIFNSDPAFKDRLVLNQFDNFQVQFACTPFTENHLRYVLATHALVQLCANKLEEIHYPAITFYIYKVH